MIACGYFFGMISARISTSLAQAPGVSERAIVRVVFGEAGSMKIWQALAVAAVGLASVSIASPANASAFLDNFDSVTPQSLQNDPQVNYAAVSPYFKITSGNGNGIITNCTDGAGCYPSGNQITSDASGTGNFLFENTAGDGPAGQNIFYVSNAFAVNPNTSYYFSFEVANATSCCYGLVDFSDSREQFICRQFCPGHNWRP